VKKESCLKIVAKREHCSVEDLEEFFAFLRRLQKPSKLTLEREIAKLSKGAMSLAVRNLEEAKCL
jgi:hypothetical protein